MFMRSWSCLLAFILALTLSAAHASDSPNLGRVATPDEIAAYDISADPDGTGLPAGSGTPAQGAKVFAAQCEACHGEKGVNGAADRLVGGQGTIAYAAKGGKKPIKTIGSFWPYATSIFAYIRRAMPFQHPKSLSSDQIYAVTAYLLNLNGVIGEADVMDAKTLPGVKMPNRDGFFPFAPAAQSAKQNKQ